MCLVIPQMSCDSAEDTAVCMPLCIPESAWNGTHCVQPETAIIEPEGETGDRIDGYAGFVTLGVLAGLGAIFLAAGVTEYYLDPAPRLPRLPEGVDPNTHHGEWSMPASVQCWVTRDTAQFHDTLTQFLSIIAEKEGVAESGEVLLMYAHRCGRTGMVLEVDETSGVTKVLFEDGVRLWVPSSALFAPLPSARDVKEMATPEPSAQRISPTTEGSSSRPLVPQRAAMPTPHSVPEFVASSSRGVGVGVTKQASFGSSVVNAAFGSGGDVLPAVPGVGNPTAVLSPTGGGGGGGGGVASPAVPASGSVSAAGVPAGAAVVRTAFSPITSPQEDQPKKRVFKASPSSSESSEQDDD